MEIRKITKYDIEELINFGKVVFPERKTYYGSLIHFIMDNRINDYTGGVALFDNKKILGFNLNTETNIWLNDNKIKTSWGFDLITAENIRKDNWGVELLLESEKLFPGHFATGSGPEAVKLAKKLKYKIIGEIKKYVGPSNLMTIPKFILPLKKSFPSKINNFYLIKDPKDFNARNYFNINLLEPERSLQWMKWRYFDCHLRSYKVYQNEQGDWFGCRIIRIKRIPLLLISDYRCDLNQVQAFSELYKTARKLAYNLNILFILCSSTNSISDLILEKNFAKPFGRPRPVIMPKQYHSWIDKNKIKDREFCFITFGDSDGEWSWLDA